jgi:hypothetical protein
MRRWVTHFDRGETGVADGSKDERLLTQLHRSVARFGNTLAGGSMSIEQQLTDEALSYARRGDFDEARHRLRLRDNPKWHSVEECQGQYDAAIAEKRARESVA